MLINSLPTKATSSFEVCPSRPLHPVGLRGANMMSLALTGIGAPHDEWRRMPDKAGGSLMTRANTSQAVSARETHGKPQLVCKPSDWMAGNRASLVPHGPTKTVFEIFARPDLSPDDRPDAARFSGAACASRAADPTAPWPRETDGAPLQP